MPMNEIKLVRVDDRLVHAQILLLWMKNYNINTVVIVDDEVARNPFMAEIYRLAMPSYVRIYICSVSEALAQASRIPQKYQGDRSRILVLMKTLQVARDLVVGGMDLPEIQIGGGATAGSIDKHEMLDALFRKNHEPLSVLISHDVTIYCQNSPQNSKVYLHRGESGRGPWA